MFSRWGARRGPVQLAGTGALREETAQMSKYMANSHGWGRRRRASTSLSVLYPIHVSITSSVKTSPRRRKSWSFRRPASASSSDCGRPWHAWPALRGPGRKCPCRAADPGRSCSGCRRAAAINTAGTRGTDCDDGSGQRNSIRLAFGLGECIGMRIGRRAVALL